MVIEVNRSIPTKLLLTRQGGDSEGVSVIDIASLLHPAYYPATGAQSRPKSHFAYHSYVFLSGRGVESDFHADYTSYRQQVLDGSSYKTLWVTLSIHSIYQSAIGKIDIFRYIAD